MGVTYRFALRLYFGVTSNFLGLTLGDYQRYSFISLSTLMFKVVDLVLAEMHVSLTKMIIPNAIEVSTFFSSCALPKALIKTSALEMGKTCAHSTLDFLNLSSVV